jgi:adenylosuccinate synthase
VFKAYSTRVGGGPMPSEIFDESAEEIRQIAQEYGTTTGRPRRIGWFDGVAGKYSQLVNGFTGLVLTRLDILDGFEKVKVCVGYTANGKEVERFPANTSLLAQCEPVYQEMPGWDRPTASATKLGQLPKNALNYVRCVEELVGCAVQIISTGPSRHETIQVSPVF